ncbi:MAG: ATP synthase F0 subunit B [Deltaproteobacteria bacterium]|nr:ATP synthase F0 subunit B [Deltaproteobacteria bacterium]
MSKGLKPGLSGIQDKQAEAPAKGTRRRIIACLVACLVLTTLWLTAAYASGGAEKEGPNWFDFVWRLFNFLALIGVLYWLLAKKTKDFFVGRREGIRTALAEAASARDEAQKKFQEYAAKLDKATGEIDQISAMIQSQGRAEKERIIEDARKAAEKMKEDTQARMEQEFQKASLELRTEAVRLSSEMAEELLKKHIREADHEAMVRDYVDTVTGKR